LKTGQLGQHNATCLAVDHKTWLQNLANLNLILLSAPCPRTSIYLPVCSLFQYLKGQIQLLATRANAPAKEQMIMVFSKAYTISTLHWFTRINIYKKFKIPYLSIFGTNVEHLSQSAKYLWF
jgi:hypothetical protein